MQWGLSQWGQLQWSQSGSYETTCPIGHFHVDNVQLNTSATNPVICNRFPAPVIPAGVELRTAPFSIPDPSYLIYKIGKRLTRAIAGDVTDTIDKVTKRITLLNGAFIEAEEGSYVRVTKSAQGNNGFYTISEVLTATTAILLEEPVADETGSFMDTIPQAGIYSKETTETLTFITADFTNNLNVPSSELASVINGKATYINATVAKETQNVRLTGQGHAYLDILPGTGQCFNAPMGGNLIRVIQTDDDDTIAATDQFLSLAFAYFTEDDVGSFLRISGSSSGNDGYYTISEVIDATKCTLLEPIPSDETGTFLATGDGVYENTTPRYLDQWAVTGELDPITFSVYDIAALGFDKIIVDLWQQGVQTTLWDSTSGTATGWTVTQSTRKSPSAGADDIWDVSLSHTTGYEFPSEDLPQLKIQAWLLGGANTTVTSEFQVEDYISPVVDEIIPWTPTRLRIKFSESMNVTGDATSPLYYRDISSRVAYYQSLLIGSTVESNIIEAPTAAFTTDDVGLFIGSTGAYNALNNGTYEILEWFSDSLVRVDKALITESEENTEYGELRPTLVISPYRITGVLPSLPDIKPVYSPIVLSAELPDPLTIPLGVTRDRFVDLILNDDLSPSCSYQIEINNITDDSGVVIGSVYSFESWTPKDVPGRSFGLWETMIPDMNKREDVSRDLERFIRCFDDVVQVVLNDIDQFGVLMDPNYTTDSVIDIMLEHLGNTLPFVSSLSIQKKRDLIPLLVPMYKQRGTAPGIEDAVQFFLNKTVQVVPADIPADTWTLGVSELGFNTYLGPSRSFIRYTFTVQHSSSVTLTLEDKAIINDIVDMVRPAHTHFDGYRIV